MDDEPHGTKLALILAAGELFAERGFDGTSIRAIAEKADANIAAISYHFGGKQELHLAALLYATSHGTGKNIPETLGNLERFETPHQMAEAIRELVHITFADLLSDVRPPWRTHVLLRAMLDESPSIATIVERTFRPDVDALMAFARHARPALSDEQARCWAFSFMGQASFYMLCGPPILAYLGTHEYSREFLDATVESVTHSLAAALNLPDAEPTTTRQPTEGVHE